MTAERTESATGEMRSRNLMDSAQDAAERAGKYVQTQVGRATDQAQGLAREASDRIADLTGRPLESWTADLRAFVREHPLSALAITVGVGYVFGKLMRRD